MARLDRLATVKGVAQLGATLGREFSYELLQAVSPLDEATLQRELEQLVEAELLYQRGCRRRRLSLQACPDSGRRLSVAAKSTRQQYHQRIAQVLEEQLSRDRETQPELLAHHYTEAGFMAQAIPYWQQAGQRALAALGPCWKRSRTSRRGLEVLKTLPDTPERAQQELTCRSLLAQR